MLRSVLPRLEEYEEVANQPLYLSRHLYVPFNQPLNDSDIDIWYKKYCLWDVTTSVAISSNTHKQVSNRPLRDLNKGHISTNSEKQSPVSLPSISGYLSNGVISPEDEFVKSQNGLLYEVPEQQKLSRTSSKTFTNELSCSETKESGEFSKVFKIIRNCYVSNRLEGNKFSKRLDVVKKTIFRKLKKHLIQNFNEFRAQVKRKAKTRESTADILEIVRSYITKNFRFTPTDQHCKSLIALIDVKCKYFKSDLKLEDRHQWVSLRTQLAKLIRSFNRNICDEVLDNSPISKIIYSGLWQKQFTTSLLKRTTDNELRERYSQQLELLKARCKQI